MTVQVGVECKIWTVMREVEMSLNTGIDIAGDLWLEMSELFHLI